MDILTGAGSPAGFNLAAQRRFDRAVDSPADAAPGLEPDFCVFAGVEAGESPEEDSRRVDGAIALLSKIRPRRLMLISTLDVFTAAGEFFEDSPVDESALPFPAANRLRLEKWAAEHTEKHIIVRLPETFGETCPRGFVRDLAFGDDAAISRTDSRKVLQLYYLGRLWEQAKKAMDMGLSLIHLANEPLGAAEIHRAVTGRDFRNEIAEVPPGPLVKSRYCSLYGGDGIGNGYVFGKHRVLADIYGFVERSRPT